MPKRPPKRPLRFVALWDLHWGYERKQRRTVPLHDAASLDLALKFAEDFKPDVFIAGGDMLDCGAISHHNDRKPGRTEGLRLFTDAEELRKAFIARVDGLTSVSRRVYIMGNHEDWLEQLVEAQPGLEGIVDIKRLLGLEAWTVVPQGGHFNLGHLTFMHGDQVTGGEHCAKASVIASERNTRFGHFHTFQAYTKISTVQSTQKHTGMSMPCLCLKGPGYGKGKANRWIQGFLYGYVWPSGMFSDYVVIITNHTAVVDGRIYRV